MKVKTLVWGLALGMLGASCSEDDTPYINVNFSGDTGVTMAAEKNAQGTLSFSTNYSWTATEDADWLTLSPTSGSAGSNTLTLVAETENRTGAPRTATVWLSTSTVRQEVQVVQEAGRYIRLERDTIHVGKDGGSVSFSFSTNMDEDEYTIYYPNQWIDDGWFNGAAGNYECHLTIAANDNEQSRTTYVYFADATEGSSGELFAQMTIVQDGSRSSESSTDFSADKTVRVLQEATLGTGIPFVLMGDGFIDTEIADGTYDLVMDKTCEHLFSEEPLASLRGYFDVYAVTAVSSTVNAGSGYGTVFSTWMKGGGSTLIEGDMDAVVEYTQCVEGIDIENALAVVILNSHEYAGTTTMGISFGNGRTEFAIAYCPVINSLDDELFRTVLCHEAVGHGFGKLDDEYAYSGTIPTVERLQVQSLQTSGWFLNVDFTNDYNDVLWSDFLADSRYANEGLGIFEGAHTYAYGAYRPSEESIMNSNILGFNAPSRQALYNKVMSLGEGREATYEEFVSFDQPTARIRKRSAGEGTRFRPFHKPQIVNRTLEK